MGGGNWSFRNPSERPVFVRHSFYRAQNSDICPLSPERPLINNFVMTTLSTPFPLHPDGLSQPNDNGTISVGRSPSFRGSSHHHFLPNTSKCLSGGRPRRHDLRRIPNLLNTGDHRPSQRDMPCGQCNYVPLHIRGICFLCGRVLPRWLEAHS